MFTVLTTNRMSADMTETSSFSFLVSCFSGNKTGLGWRKGAGSSALLARSSQDVSGFELGLLDTNASC